MKNPEKLSSLYRGNDIRTFTGLYVDVFNPTEEMINIEDIAHGLSNTARFGGHTKEFCSVAQHSVLCSRMAEKKKFQALMHDAGEAYMGDMPKPIKNGFPEFAKAEEKLMAVIARKFEFQWPLHPHIKEVDQKALEMEHFEHMLGRPVQEMSDLLLEKEEPHRFMNLNKLPWDPWTAKVMFLMEFQQLSQQPNE